MRINDLFGIIAINVTDQKAKSSMFKLLRLVLRHRKDMNLLNDVADLYDNVDEVVEALEDIVPDANELLDTVFELPEVSAYLDSEKEDSNSVNGCDEDTTASTYSDRFQSIQPFGLYVLGALNLAVSASILGKMIYDKVFI